MKQSLVCSVVIASLMGSTHNAVLAADPWTTLSPPAYQFDSNYHTYSGITENYLRALEFADPRMVAGGSHGTLAFSDDGLTWSPATLSQTIKNAAIRDVVYSNGTWIAVTDATGRPVATTAPRDLRVYSLRSVDGAVWTVNGNVLSGTQTGFRQLAADGVGGWVAATELGRVAVSADDGVTWTTVQVAPSTHLMTGVAYFGGKWYAAGNAPVGVAGAMVGVLFQSTDRGATWSQARLFAHTIDALSVANNRLFAIGDKGAISSTNGTLWVLHYFEPTGWVSLRDIIWSSSGGYVAAGEGGVLLRSKNLLTWTYGYLPNDNRSFIFDLINTPNGNSFKAATGSMGYFEGSPNQIFK